MFDSPSHFDKLSTCPKPLLPGEGAFGSRECWVCWPFVYAEGFFLFLAKTGCGWDGLVLSCGSLRDVALCTDLREFERAD